MKGIAFVISSLGSGGAERVVSVLSDEFSKVGIETTVIMVHNSNVYYQVSDKVRLVGLECERDNSLGTLKRNAIRLRKIRRAVEEVNPDAVISFMAETNIDVCMALLGKRVPVFVSERNDPKRDPKGYIKQIMRKILYRKPSGFVFQTFEAQAFFGEAVRRRSEVILNPLSASLPDRYEGERDKRIVSVGRLNKQKNYPLLFDALTDIFRDYPEYHLDIYGEGVLEGALKEDVARRGIGEKVVFHGFCADVHSKIVNAEMFVMPSDFEGMPNALIEAMAIGVPCISTDCPCGGPKMVIQDGKNGTLVPVGDRDKLSLAIRKYIEDKEYALGLGKEAAKIKEKLKCASIAKQWLEFIEKCLNARKRKSR